MPNLNYISPLFIVSNLQASISFYKEKMGFELYHIGPEDHEPFFAIVGRENVSIMLKEIAPEIKPVPNHTWHEYARIDAFISTNDPDKLYEEFNLKNISFHQPLKNDDDNLRGFEVADADGYILFFGRPV